MNSPLDRKNTETSARVAAESYWIDVLWVIGSRGSDTQHTDARVCLGSDTGQPAVSVTPTSNLRRQELKRRSRRRKLKAERKNQRGRRDADSDNAQYHSTVQTRCQEHTGSPAEAGGNCLIHRRGGTDDEEHKTGEDQEPDKCRQPANQSSRAPTG